MDFLSSGTRSKFSSAFADVNVFFPSSSPSLSAAGHSSEPSLMSRITIVAAPAAASTRMYFPAAPPLSSPPRQGVPIISDAMQNKWELQPRIHTLLYGVSLPPSPTKPPAHHKMWQWCQANTGFVNFPPAPNFTATTTGFRVRMTLDVFVSSLADAQTLRAMATDRQPVWLSRIG